nr:transcriptional regulator [Rhizobium sp. Q54]
MMGDLCQLIDMIDLASDERMIKQVLRNFALGSGFSWFAYINVEGSRLRTMSNYPAEWQKVYLTKLYQRVDPVISEARRRMEPFRWSCETWGRPRGSSGRDFWEEVARHGIRSGLTIPVEGSFGSRIMLTFSSRNTDAGRLEPIQPRKAEQAALAIHYRLQGLKFEAGRHSAPALSPRELLCLTWVSKGKVGHEIAELSNIRPRTVQHYLDNARRKLDAATVPQLVAIAKDRRLV